MVHRKDSQARTCGGNTLTYTDKNCLLFWNLRRHNPDANRSNSMANKRPPNRQLHNSPPNHRRTCPHPKTHQRLPMGSPTRTNRRRISRRRSLLLLPPARNSLRNRRHMGLRHNLHGASSNRLHGLQIHTRRPKTRRNPTSIKTSNLHNRLRMHRPRNTPTTRHEPLRTTNYYLRKNKKEREEKKGLFLTLNSNFCNDTSSNSSAHVTNRKPTELRELFVGFNSDRLNRLKLYNRAVTSL